MKELFTQYGEAAIAVFIALAVLPFFLRIALPQTEGESAAATESFHAYASEGKMEATYKNVAITEQQWVPVEAHFAAAAADGGGVPLHVLVVFDEEGKRIHSAKREGREELWFPKAGIYTVYFETRDDIGRVQYGRLRIPVQRKLV